jgi:hypothetical protein
MTPTPDVNTIFADDAYCWTERAHVARAWLVVVAVVFCSILDGGIAGASPTAVVRLEANGLGVVSFGATTSSAIKTITDVLGAPTGNPSVGCTGDYSQTAWHDLIAQFKNGRFAGYRYLAGGSSGLSPTTTSIRGAKIPRLATTTGITLGDTFAEVRLAYPMLEQSGSDAWRTSSGIVFAFFDEGDAVPTSPIYDIKNDVCPGAL